VTLSGVITPATPDEVVTILDGAGATVAAPSTDGAGAYSVDVFPTAAVTVHAEWSGASSSPVDITVQAIVKLSLTELRLFGDAVVSGKVMPAHPGAKVTIAITHGGGVVATRHPLQRAAGGFRATFPVSDPGAYRARARFGDADHVEGSDAAGPRTTPLPDLHVGSDSVYVRLLEGRLLQLNYRLVKINQQFDFRTADAVMAFTKVQEMRRRSTVDAAVWKKLADPRRPRARVKSDGFHIEIDQTHQVLYTVNDGIITNILHVSTGKPSTPTNDGTFHVYKKIAGFSGSGLYYPSYFEGGKAIHGWPDVPDYNASHGCVRVPFWNAPWIFRQAPIGTKVVIYHKG
jgi:hypothetical protein